MSRPAGPGLTPRRWPWAAPHQLYLAAGDPAPLARFADWCSAHPGSRVELTVGAGYQYSLLCTDDRLPLRRPREVQDWARAQFLHVHGAAASTWPVTSWGHAPCFAASALHGIDLGALQQLAVRHRVQVRRLRPWWPQALAQARRHDPDWTTRPGTALVAAEGEWVTWLSCLRGRPNALEQRRLAQPTLAALLELCEMRRAEGHADPGLPHVVAFGMRDTRWPPGLKGLNARPADATPETAWLA
ncbi:MAG: hypothetical protein ACKVQR_06010 [Aquabacterium sp.]